MPSKNLLRNRQTLLVLADFGVPYVVRYWSKPASMGVGPLFQSRYIKVRRLKLGFRDLRASLAQFNLLPLDPEEDRQSRIERFVEESVRLSCSEADEIVSALNNDPEEWTVVYDKFQMRNR